MKKLPVTNDFVMKGHCSGQKAIIFKMAKYQQQEDHNIGKQIKLNQKHDIRHEIASKSHQKQKFERRNNLLLCSKFL